MMNALSVFKNVAELAVTTGVGAIVSNAAKSAIPANAHIVKKVTIAFGTFILSSMVAEQAVKYTEDKIDYGLQQYNETKQAMADAVKQQQQEEAAAKTNGETEENK
jgi:hypothetical protein